MGKLETPVEDYLDVQIQCLGGLTRKFVSPGHAGVADRLCFLPNGILYIVEVKHDRGGEKSSQQRERKRMFDLGFHAVIIHGKSGVDSLIEMIRMHIPS